MKLKNITAAIAIAAALLPGAVQAHRGWMLPSATVLSGNEPWVTVDAAISNDLFYFEHQPMALDNLVVFNPDGSKGAHENAGKGRYRSTFDVKLSQPGTYKIAIINNGANASFKVDGAQKRVRAASLEALTKQIPANAQDVQVSVAAGRNEIFVTSGKPTATALAPTGQGLELVPITHPNDLIAGETAQFRFVLDGQPAANLAVTVIPGGIRYRDKLGEIKLTSDAEGKVSIKWPEPGMYWLTAAPARDADAPRGAAGTLEKPARRASYTTTLEVLAQ